MPGRWMILTVAGALVAGACVSSSDWNAAGTTWNREETGYEQFEKDKADCEAEAQSQVAECLRNKGYFPWAERSPQERARETVPSF